MTTDDPTEQNPKRQHIVHEMLLRNFQREDTKVHAYLKAQDKHIRTSPGNLFVVKHRYTLRG